MSKSTEFLDILDKLDEIIEDHNHGTESYHDETFARALRLILIHLEVFSNRG